MRKSRIGITMQFVWVIILNFGCLGVDGALNHATPLLHSELRFLYALAASGIIYYILRTTKVRNDHINYSTITKIWGVLLIIAFLVLFFVKQHVMLNVYEIFKSYTIVADTLMALSIGFFEEFLSRGLLLSTFMQIFKNATLKYTFAACSSAICFGLFHFINLASGQPLIPTIQQVIYAFVIGVMFASVRIVTNSMIWPVLLHTLFDWQMGISYITNRDYTTPWLSFFTSWGALLIVTIVFLISLDHSANRSQPIKKLKMPNQI